MTIFRCLIIGHLVTLASGCVFPSQTTYQKTELANHAGASAQGASACSDTIEATRDAGDSKRLDSDDIDLLVWNIHKNKHPDALNDLADLAGNMDLVLLQEASHANSSRDRSQQASYWSFAPGFRAAGALTGVMTISRIQPLAHCILQVREPWLGTPKAIGITEFSLSDSEQTLAVVNIHGVNFTFGVSDFSEQLATIRAVIEKHDGPVIIAGDFNTWNDGRVAQVEQLADDLGMTELIFAVDHRVSPFSHKLDRVLIRGLRVRDATTAIVDSSDHNPLTVRLSL